MKHMATEQTGRVLVIDDNAVIKRLATMLLVKKGHSVETASSGSEGIVCAKSFKPHVILLDVMMPEIDGYEVCRCLKAEAETKDIPIIMVTSRAEIVDKVKGLELGAADYVQKPYDHEELQARVATQIKMKTLWDELQEKNKLLEELVKKDGLTNLYNHRYFHDRIVEEFSRSKRYGLALSCVLVDIDFFKKINDTYGHQAGDEILKKLAGIILASIRDVDVAARYGGEEFAIILPHTTLENAATYSERLRRSVDEADFQFEGNSIKVTVSLGVASLPENRPQTHTDIIRFADDALYAAKNAGRNRIEQYRN
jgi:two-component system, cell cycle response regulator